MKGNKRVPNSYASTAFQLLIFVLGVFMGVVLYSQYLSSQQNNPSLPTPPATSMRGSSTELSSSKEECSVLIDQYVSGNRSASSNRLKTRKEFPEYLNYLGLTGEAVEVGVKDGVFSRWILSHWSGKKYHLVDPWMEQDQTVYIDIANVNQKGQDSKYQKVKDLMESSFPGRYVLHRNYSVNVAQQLLRESSNQPRFDFIYLDARHDYEGIKEDLEAWWPLLKKGGLYAGHDFVEDGTNKNGLFGVQKAVKEFVERNGKEVMSISEKDFHGGRKGPKQRIDYGWTTWYFFK